MKDAYQVFPHPSLDWRLTPTRHTNTRMTARHFSTREEVEQRREELVFNLRMATGLYPYPDKTPLNVRREKVGDFDGFTVEKVMYESFPGLWSTGNLYLPRVLKGKAPAILYCMGHWEQQRLTRDDSTDVPQQLGNLARMGFVCLVTDMIGKIDSRQISHEYGRGEKDLWLSNGAGVQLWNNIRAVDLLCEMPEVDAERIGMTGCSGGATQTLNLSLLDERIKAIAPINMISLEMQGGCQCENAPGLRRETENCEMCCMLAPRPLFVPGSTGDWTRNLLFNEYPVLQEVYRLYDAEDKLEAYFQVAPHQYNARTRHRVYRFFARTLMGQDIQWEEQPVDVGNMQDLTWFRCEGHAPGFSNDEEFFAAHKAELTHRTATLDASARKKMLAWISGIRERAYFTADASTSTLDDLQMEHNVAIAAGGVQVPFIRLTPPDWDGQRVCLVLSGEGKDCLDNPAIRQMLRNGVCIISGDLFLLGETADRQRMPIPDAQDERHYTCFHYTDDAYRMQDAALLWQITRATAPECTLWAEGTAARAIACALPLLPGAKHAHLEDAALHLADDEDYLAHFNVPGIMLVGGIEGCLALTDCPSTRF